MHQGEASKGNAALCQAAGAFGARICCPEGPKEASGCKADRQTWGSGCDSSPSLKLTAVGLGRTGSRGVPSTAAFGPMHNASAAASALRRKMEEPMRGMRLTTAIRPRPAMHCLREPSIPGFYAAGPQAAAKLSFGAATTARSEVRQDGPDAGELRRG
jgi:hypothetical protein